MLPLVRHLARSTFDLLFPPTCLACEKSLASSAAPLLCTGCLEKLSLPKEPFCTCCGKPFPKAAGGNHLCGTCLSKPFHFSQARTLFYYNKPFSDLIHSFKYQGSMAGLSTFAWLYQQQLENSYDEMDLILPVPLHKTRLKERGFNQALILARTLLPDKRHKIMPHLLNRPLWTEPQTNFNGAARRKNLKQAFQIQDPEPVRGKNILIIDDVFTTGTTVNECAKLLKRAKAKDIQVLTLARVEE